MAIVLHPETGNLIAGITFALIGAIPLYLLRRGSLRKAAMIYLVGMWFSCSAAIELNGGIRSPALVMYVALPISAAWLFGYRGTVLTSAACIGCVFVLALIAAGGAKPHMVFPGRPFGIMAVVVGAS